MNEDNKAGLAQLRDTLIEAHREVCDTTDDLLIGLQLTHSGRFSRPDEKMRPEPRMLYHHALLDARVNVDDGYPVVTDSEIRQIIEDFHHAARVANDLGYDFVDIKHCHGYLGHEFLSAHTREGNYGGSFENRTRFLREVTEGIRAVAPGLQIGVRLSAFDLVAFRADPERSISGRMGPGIPERRDDLIPYRWGFGVDTQNPGRYDLHEPRKFLSLLRELDIRLVNRTARQSYFNPSIQRPALYPPSDGYQPPEDPLHAVAQHMNVTREIKKQFPKLIFVGTAYSYLQDFLPHVAQAAVREEWTDLVGLGRMVLTYPDILWDATEGNEIQHKRICRTFSDCTTAPRKGLPSGCYPLDSYSNSSALAHLLKLAMAG